VACEFSGVVRRAFRERGHNAWSCDLLPAEDGSPYHFQEDVCGPMCQLQWDLAIFHPPCTFLNNAGIRWLYKGGRKENGKDPQRWENMYKAVWFYSLLRQSHTYIPRVALENSEMHTYAKALLGEPDQDVQPWMFGHPEFKCISLQLRNLPKLIPTNQLTPPAHGTQEYKDWSRVHREAPGPNRANNRSRFLPGVADAMAEQWGIL
jgi:hypothetical protein